MAAGTRTAPATTGTASYQLASFSLVDVSGDQRSVSVQGLPSTTLAQWEALATALQAATQASLFAVNIQTVFEGDKDTGNAVSGSRDSVYDNVTTLLKNTARVSRDVFIPAPAPEIMFLSNDEVDPASTELIAFFNAVVAVSSGFTIRSARFTERREINKRVLI